MASSFFEEVILSLKMYKADFQFAAASTRQMQDSSIQVDSAFPAATNIDLEAYNETERVVLVLKVFAGTVLSLIYASLSRIDFHFASLPS